MAYAAVSRGEDVAFEEREDEFRFNDETFETVIKDYFTKDLAI